MPRLRGKGKGVKGDGVSRGQRHESSVLTRRVIHDIKMTKRTNTSCDLKQRKGNSSNGPSEVVRPGGSVSGMLAKSPKKRLVQIDDVPLPKKVSR